MSTATRATTLPDAERWRSHVGEEGARAVGGFVAARRADHLGRTPDTRVLGLPRRYDTGCHVLSFGAAWQRTLR